MEAIAIEFSALSTLKFAGITKLSQQDFQMYIDNAKHTFSVMGDKWKKPYYDMIKARDEFVDRRVKRGMDKIIAMEVWHKRQFGTITII